MKRLVVGLLFVVVAFSFLVSFVQTKKEVLSEKEEKKVYWLLLERKSNIEKLYKGTPGDEEMSVLVKSFTVKTGIPGERPTPLPKLAGREYWVITDKMSDQNPETAPYFLTLDVPWTEEEPYGPVPYEECPAFAEGFGGQAVKLKQCNWVTAGPFGLHGVNGDESKLGPEDPGSSGCVRHKDEDITYLYELLDPKREEIRYYVEDI